MSKKTTFTLPYAVIVCLASIVGCSSSKKSVEEPAPAYAADPAPPAASDTIDLGASSAGRAN